MASNKEFLCGFLRSFFVLVTSIQYSKATTKTQYLAEILPPTRFAFDTQQNRTSSIDISDIEATESCDYFSGLVCSLLGKGEVAQRHIKAGLAATVSFKVAYGAWNGNHFPLFSLSTPDKRTKGFFTFPPLNC